MLILLTNDDGIKAEGLQVLRRELSRNWEVYVVAPKKEQSASSHSLTLNRRLRVKRQDKMAVSVDGTPTDCVMIGVHRILPRQPDLIVSGINHGPNLGDDVTYSGTVAAAMEGALLGIPSVAISLIGWQRGSFVCAARFAFRLADKLLATGPSRNTLLNVNIPDLPEEEIEGVKITRLGRRIYLDPVVEEVDPNGEVCYSIGGERCEKNDEVGTDFSAIEQNMISITPLHLDLTDYGTIKLMEEWEYTSLWGRERSGLPQGQRADGGTAARAPGDR